MTNAPELPGDDRRDLTPEEIELFKAHGFDVTGPMISLSDLIAELEARQTPPAGPPS